MNTDKGSGGVPKGVDVHLEMEVNGDDDEEGEEFSFVRDHDLLGGLSDFYNNSKLSDITLTVGSHRFQAHKFLLSCVSPVFRQMLDDSNNWPESKEPNIVLTVSKPPLHFLLATFILTSSFSRSYQSVKRYLKCFFSSSTIDKLF